MGVLTSKVFTSADPATTQKLEDCASAQPNEVKSHFALGQNGEHVRRVQEALQSVQQEHPELGIPEFSVNGLYDQKFASAIRVYKFKRNILNYANKIDDIVGMKTIRSLDQENKSPPPKVNPKPSPRPKKPGEFPKPLPNCVPDSLCPSANEFEVTLIAAFSGGEGFEIGKYYFSIRDTKNGLSAIYFLRVIGGGLGSPVSASFAGTPKHFTTSVAVRVTRFGPGGAIGAFTDMTTKLNGALLSLGYHPDGLVPRPTAPMTINTGPIAVPGMNMHGGQLSIITQCNGGPGASRRVLGFLDYTADE
jgi:hypothetical protein